MSQGVVLITGASSGLGAKTARALADTGHTAYASIQQQLRRLGAPPLRQQNQPLAGCR